MPTRTYVAAAALLASVIAVGWFVFATHRYAELFGACTVFAVVALGLPSLLARIATRRRDLERGAPRRLTGTTVETLTGLLSAKQATVQILLIPGAVALGFTAIAVVELLVGHTA